LINAEIAAAKAGSPLYKKAPLEDPSENLIMTLVKPWGIHAAAVTVWS
jgi:hypothetical protein